MVRKIIHDCKIDLWLMQDFVSEQGLDKHCKQVLYYGPDHVRLTLLNWDNQSVLSLDKKLKFPIHFQFFNI